MSQDTTPQVLLDPGECISASGDLRGPILSRLRSACAPVLIADLLASHHADRHPAIRDTLRDLEYFGAVRIDGKSVVALHGNGKPYTRAEKRERIEGSTFIKPQETPCPWFAATTRPSKPKKATPKAPRDRTAPPKQQVYRVRQWSVAEAREMLASGVSLRKIAAKMGVCHKSVQRALGLST